MRRRSLGRYAWRRLWRRAASIANAARAEAQACAALIMQDGAEPRLRRCSVATARRADHPRGLR